MKRYLTLKVVGKVGEKDVMVLINLGESHNFIDASFVEKKNPNAKGFNANKKLMLMDHIIERYEVRLKSCTVRQNLMSIP